MDVLLRRAVEVDATVARYGSEFAVLDAGFAVGGQRLTLQGLGGVYDEIFLPLAGEHQAANAAWRWPPSRRSSAPGPGGSWTSPRCRTVSPRSRRRAGWSGSGRSPTILVDAAHNPARGAGSGRALAEEFAFTRLVGVLAVMADKDVARHSRGAGRRVRRGRGHGQLLAAVDAGGSSWPTSPAASSARTGCIAAARMDDAIALAVDLAETGRTSRRRRPAPA